MEKTSFFDRFNTWARKSVTLKLISIAILILLLLIPSAMISSLIYERENIRDNAIKEVSEKWGGHQTIGGPVLTLPYYSRSVDDKGKTYTTIRFAHFLPDELNIDGALTPEKRYRGIYVVVLYNSQLRISGTFSEPDLDVLNIPESDFIFKDAFISTGITDMKGIKENINFNWNDTVYSFNPGIPTHEIFSSGASFPVNLQKSGKYNFSFNINLNGSSTINFLPFGKQTNVTLSSTCQSPSFEGYKLPDSRTVDANGFKATWKMTQLNRNYPQQGLGSFIGNPDGNEDYNDKSDNTYGAFGVRLLLPIDEYQKTTRSVKYCLMFIIITFLTFFFVEVLNKKRIHAIQYLLVGFAVCLFYVLLLSISEHLKFNSAYLISCLCILTLVTFYAWHIFKNAKLTAIFSGLLALLYGFFYSLMQLEDYALLLGSAGLFMILATIMYLTRKIDWYGISSGEEK
jgi:inner membrane protein